MRQEILLFVHLVMATLAVYRITELFTIDRITDPLRRRFSFYLWTCPRCLSVWAGIYVTAAFFVLPWLNWPFALSWLYFAHNDAVYNRRLLNKGRQLVVEINDKGANIVRAELKPEELERIFAFLKDPDSVSQKPPNGGEAENPIHAKTN